MSSQSESAPPGWKSPWKRSVKQREHFCSVTAENSPVSHVLLGDEHAK